MSQPRDGRQVSIHYLIGREFGQIHSMVPEDRVAFHANSHNRRSIGIEMYKLKTDSGDFADWQYSAVSQLVYDFMLRYGVSRKDVVAHASVQPKNRSDPRGFDWSRFDDLLKKTAGFARFFNPRFSLSI